MKVRSVARPVANLGNTCYMNAVLQALAHAPDLLLAMDCEPHRQICPVAKRQLRKSPSPPEGTRKSSRRRGDTEANEFCALCEVENHLQQAHQNDSKKPVAPSSFVNGFIDRVAPWFRLGVQEDSHEFLRLLIDAMQKSCQNARNQSVTQGDTGSNVSKEADKEYPFSLFRGLVESQVVCGYCNACSSTKDPIEDVGLEVATTPPTDRTSRSSRNTSPTTLPLLLDVKTAFDKYAKREALDSSYKCEKCGKEGRATKQTRLASIPPILTLHLKRFRYGDRIAPVAPVRRSNRSELSQLGGDAVAGKSGAAKVEGHVKFDLIFDLKQFLTEELQQVHKNMYCRLFAVIVHAGTSPHSGHYIAYVRNISKNEWWRMDDSRVTAVTADEVMKAEAYMLFYRVVNHPVAQNLEERQKHPVEQQPPHIPEVIPQPLPSEKKRSLEVADDEVARKTSFPPHLLCLFDKIATMIADDVEVKENYFDGLREGSPNVKLEESDIVGGTDHYKHVLREVLYRLKDHPSALDTWLASFQQVAVEAEPDDTGLL